MMNRTHDSPRLIYHSGIDEYVFNNPLKEVNDDGTD